MSSSRPIVARHRATFVGGAARGYTLIELMVVLAIAAVLATMVLPMMHNDDRLRVIAAAQLVQSDLEFAQSLSISEPEDRAAVKFDPSAGSYYVARWSDTTTPIVRSDIGTDYAVTLGLGRATAADGVTMSLANITSDLLEYDSHGGLRDFSNVPVITLQSNDHWLKLTIEPTTGSIAQSSGTGTP